MTFARRPGARFNRGRVAAVADPAPPALNTPTIAVQEGGVDSHAENEGADLNTIVTVDDGDGFTTTDARLYDNGVLISSMVDGGGGSWSLAVNDVVPGDHSYRALRVTASGSKLSAAWDVTVTPQVPTLSAPADEASFAVGDDITFTADGSAPGWDTNTTKVEFYLDAVLVTTANSPTAGAWTADWDSTGATPGTNLSVVAKRYWTGVGTGTVDSTVATDIDLTAGGITLVSVATNAAGDKIIVTCSATVDPGSVPALVDFTLAGPALSVLTGTPVVSGVTVELDVSPPICDDETGVTLSYTAGANPIQDMSGNDLANFTTQAVTNNSTHEFVPTDIPDCVLWIDMLDSGAFTESAGVITGVTNKVSSTVWNTGTLPAYSATAMGGTHPGMDLNGTTHGVISTEAAVVSALTDAGPLTACFVCSPDNADRAETIFGAGDSAQATMRRKLFGKSATGAGSYQVQSTNNAGTTATIAGTAGTSASGAQVLDWTFTGTTLSVQKNGGAADPNAAAWGPGTLTPNRCAIGIRPGSTPDVPFDGKVGEMIIYSRDLSSAEKSRVRVTRGARWSISVTP